MPSRGKSNSAPGRWPTSNLSPCPGIAMLGAHEALDHDLGIFAAIIIGLIETSTGGVFIDLFSGVTPILAIDSL